MSINLPPIDRKAKAIFVLQNLNFIKWKYDPLSKKVPSECRETFRRYESDQLIRRLEGFL